MGDREGPRPTASRAERGVELPAGTDFVLGKDFDIPKGQKAKYRANVDAIKLLKTVETEGHLATPVEQAVLARCTGWGGLPHALLLAVTWLSRSSMQCFKP